MTETVVMADADAPVPATPFRWRLSVRPDLRFGHAAGGVAGILVAAAIVAFVVEVTDDDPTLPGVGFNALLIVAALAAGFFVRGPVRSAGVSAIVIAIPQVWLFAIIGDGSSAPDRGDFRLILLLSAVSYAVFYALTWTRGRAVMLGAALLLLAGWIVFEVASASAPFSDFAAQAQRGTEFDDSLSIFGNGDRTTEIGLTELVIAVVLLGGAVLLDRRGRAGAATPLLLVGGLYAVNAAATLGGDANDVYAIGAFIAIAGIVIGLAGSLGRRRGTSWIGALVLFAGALVVVGQGTSDATSGDGTDVFGGFALVAAAVLLLIGVLVARAAAEPIDGGEPVIEKTPAPEPEPEPALVAATTPITETTEIPETTTAAPETTTAATEAPAPEQTTETTETTAAATEAPAPEPSTDEMPPDPPSPDETPTSDESSDGDPWSGPPPES